MTGFDNIYSLSAGVELFAASIIAVLLMGCYMERRFFNEANKIFAAVLVIQMMLLIGDAEIWLLLNKPSAEKIPLVKALTLLTDIMTVILTGAYTQFIANYISQKTRISFIFPRIISGICAVIVVVWCACLFNDLYIWYGADGSEHEGPLYMVIQVSGTLLMIACVLFTLWNHRALGRRDTFILSTYGLFPLLGYLFERYWPVTPLLLALTLSLVLMYVVIHTQQTHSAMEKEMQLAHMETKLARQETELSQSRINIMISQIQPHFLFNALTSISALCEKDPIKAQTALNNFADYLRGNLDSLKRTVPVPFYRELKHVEIYLSLEKMRFESELNVVYDIQTKGFMIPALTIQPLVENAVRYGVGKKEGGGTVTISAREQESCYVVTVADDGVGFDTKQRNTSGIHIGIDNVRSRLDAMVGGTLTIESEKDKGTLAEIRIPKERNT